MITETKCPFCKSGSLIVRVRTPEGSANRWTAYCSRGTRKCRTKEASSQVDSQQAVERWLAKVAAGDLRESVQGRNTSPGWRTIDKASQTCPRCGLRVFGDTCSPCLPMHADQLDVARESGYRVYL